MKVNENLSVTWLKRV